MPSPGTSLSWVLQAKLLPWCQGRRATARDLAVLVAGANTAWAVGGKKGGVPPSVVTKHGHGQDTGGVFSRGPPPPIPTAAPGVPAWTQGWESLCRPAVLGQ